MPYRSSAPPVYGLSIILQAVTGVLLILDIALVHLCTRTLSWSIIIGLQGRAATLPIVVIYLTFPSSDRHAHDPSPSSSFSCIYHISDSLSYSCFAMLRHFLSCVGVSNATSGGKVWRVMHPEVYRSFAVKVPAKHHS